MVHVIICAVSQTKGKAKKKYEEEEDGNREEVVCDLCIRFIFTSVDNSFSGESSNSQIGLEYKNKAILVLLIQLYC